MSFAYWPVLLLIFLIPLFHHVWMRRNRPAAVTFSRSIPRSLKRKSPVWILLFLKYFALSCFIIALARPQSSFTEVRRKASGVDIMLVFDVSQSMNAEDVEGLSRLEVAKESVRQFIEGRESDRIGLVIFSGEALTLAPPTLDYGLVLDRLHRDTITGVLKDGTAIGDGLALGVSRLRTSEAKSRVIILLTDGDNNVGQIDPLTAGELATAYGIRVHSIAFGKEGRVKIPFKRPGPDGRQHVVAVRWQHEAINPELLIQISENTGGNSTEFLMSKRFKMFMQKLIVLKKQNSKPKRQFVIRKSFLCS
jgi:Ca-activated chloride channel homolog